MWPLPLVCMLGISGSAMFAFSGGVFMESVTGEFGWSRAQYSSAFMVMMVSGLFLGPTTGWLIDRIGPRKVALVGIVPFGVSIALFGLVDGPLWQWYAICLLVAAFQAAISQIVWVKAIVARFDHSRGLALAVTLAGLGFGSWAPPKTPRKSGSDLIHSFVVGRGDEAGGIVRAFGPFEAAFGAW